MDLSRIKERLEYLRGAAMNLTNGGFADKEGNITRPIYDICMAAFRRDRTLGTMPMFVSYNASGNEEYWNSPTTRGLIEGDALSMKWLKFIMDPEISPFRSHLKYHLITDLEWINEKGGFCLDNFEDANGGEMLGFFIATRFCQEKRRNALQWEKYVDSGIDPRIAYALIYYFWKDGKTVGLANPSGHHCFYQGPMTWIKNFWNGEWPYGFSASRAYMDGWSSDSAIGSTNHWANRKGVKYVWDASTCPIIERHGGKATLEQIIAGLSEEIKGEFNRG